MVELLRPFRCLYWFREIGEGLELEVKKTENAVMFSSKPMSSCN